MNHISKREKFDIFILEQIRSKLSNPILDKIMVMFTMLGEFGAVWSLLGIALVIESKYRIIGLMVIAALIFTTIMGEGVIKNLVKRSRPCKDMTQQDLVVRKPNTYSFPSGHTASSFAVANVLLTCFAGVGVAFLIIASLIAFSRMYLYVHYPTDIIAGIALGLLCSQATIYMFQTFMVRI